MRRTIKEITFTRRKPPDKDCQFCQGTGYWRGTDIPCVCLTDFSSMVETEKEVDIYVKMSKDGGAIVTVKE